MDDAAPQWFEFGELGLGKIHHVITPRGLVVGDQTDNGPSGR